ncbi:hypothetical protein KR009_011925, partial [Drosophila setifemur]
KPRTTVEMNISQRNHRDKLRNTTKNWGKTKFKPQPFKFKKPEVPPDPQETAVPWNHVKNDIIDDSEEVNNAGRLNIDSRDAKKFMQQREQNHRKNIIESSRSEPTKWESFDDEPSASKGRKHNKIRKNKGPSSEKTAEERDPKELSTDVDNFTFKERNFYRRKLTLGVMLAKNKPTLENAIHDLRQNAGQLTNIGFKYKKETTTHKKKGKKPIKKKGQNANNPFRKQKE